MMFAVFGVFATYSSALHTSLVRVQGFSLMITTHNYTALKENGMTEDIFIKFWAPARSLLILIYNPIIIFCSLWWRPQYFFQKRST